MAQKKTTVKSEPFISSQALENEYKRDIRYLVNAMLKDVAKGFVDTYRKNKEGFALDSAANNIDNKIKELEKKYRRIFETQGEVIAKRMIMRQVRYCRSSFKKVISKLLPKETEVPSIAGSVIPRDVEEVVRASIMENVSLIKSIQQRYFEQVTGSITRSMQAGGSIKQLRNEILKYNGMTKRRADNIAADQTRKAYAAITLRNMKNAGIEKAEWMHSGGGYTVREYHYRKWDGVSGKSDGHPNGLNGFIFDINKPPVIQEADGKQQEIRGYPRQLPNCKCVMRAIIELEAV